jgi:hypothetical protein
MHFYALAAMDSSESVLVNHVPHSYVSTTFRRIEAEIHLKERRFGTVSDKDSVLATEERMVAHFTDAVAEIYRDIVNV